MDGLCLIYPGRGRIQAHEFEGRHGNQHTTGISLGEINCGKLDFLPGMCAEVIKSLTHDSLMAEEAETSTDAT